MSVFTLRDVIAREKDENLILFGVVKEFITGSDEPVILNLKDVKKITIHARKPDNTIISVPTIIINRSIGTIEYQTVGAFFKGQRAGLWEFMIQVEFTDKKIKYSDPTTRKVGESIA